MTPEHQSTLELITALHALDPTTAEIVVDKVRIVFSKVVVPVEFTPDDVAKLRAEVQALEHQNQELREHVAEVNPY